ncbi:DUF7159 family protein [Mycobacterium hubeiense]|uniref:DUF7159 family protein n=1 Tax=Mycobacterium hubeiense TaxID=1867256 RepID=UPI000C7ED8E2|nr:hypothetical protein [Mycobacterium sp. QGD 101]
MDLVLGLALTSRAVRWVLVEGATGEGAPIDCGALAIEDMATFDPGGLLHGLVDDTLAADNRLHAIGVTWTTQADTAASTVMDALAARDLDNVIAVSESEAADALASGIADIAEYDDVVVCVIEPDAAVIAMVDADGVMVDRIDRPADGSDADELAGLVIAMLESTDRRPDAVFVVGSDELDAIVSSLAASTDSPIISAEEAGLAMARGAALASALAVNTLDALAFAKPHRLSRTGALASVLAAAVVTFVVSLSVALGLQLTPDAEQPQMASAVDKPVAIPSAAQAKPKLPRPVAPPPAPAPLPPAAPPPAVEPIPVAEPVYEAPEYVPPAPVYEPPEPVAPPPPPAYVPPPAPAYVPPPAYPPPATYPQPRLRDRIIERIPIINRFHEPKWEYGP